jgi:hypothetical protein
VAILSEVEPRGNARLIEKAVIAVFLGSAQGQISIIRKSRGPPSPVGLGKELNSSHLEFGLLFALLISLISMPRRPEVFYQSRPVDHQRGASLLALFSFSWASRVQKKALRQPLSLSDIPCVGHNLRSRTLDSRFQQRKGLGRLWAQLLQTFWIPLTRQWIIALLRSLASFGVQISLHRFLQQLEGEGNAVWTWISALAFCLVAEAAVGCWLQSLSETQHEIPTIAQITLLVFRKSLRRSLSHQTQKDRNSLNAENRISEINLLRTDM